MISGHRQLRLARRNSVAIAVRSALFEGLEQRQMFDDNVISRANDLGALNSAISVSDVINAGDTKDFYKVQHSGGRFIASITNATNSAQLELAQDVDNSGGINRNPGTNEVIANPIAVNPKIDIANLPAGTYFLGVFRQTADTNYTLTASPSSDFGGTSLATARNVGAPGNTAFSDSIRLGGDTSDFFKLTLAETRLVSMQLGGLSQDAGFRVVRDVVNPNTVDLGEQLFTVDLNTNAAQGETRQVALSAGTYFVEIFAKSATTSNYTFTIATNVVATPDDAGGESTSQPVAIGPLDTQPHGFSDFVGNSDQADFYGFTLTRTSTLRGELRGLTSDADLQIIRLVSNGQGFVEQVVLASPFGGTSDEVTEGSILPGNYFAKVAKAQNGGDTNYLLKLQITQVDGAGETRDAARDVGTLSRNATANKTFNDRIGGVDTDDFYQFAVDDFRRVSVRVSGLNAAIQADADLEIFNSSGTKIGQSSHAGSVNETATLDLLPGTYFARVKPILGESNYTIRFTSVQGTDTPGETLANAKNFGNINSTGLRTFATAEFVGGSDSSDLYKFTTTKGFRYSRPFLGNDFSLDLITDKNGNGNIDSGEVNSGVSADLVPGMYFLRTRPASNTVARTYDLKPSFFDIDTFGNSRATALDLGDSPNGSFSGYIGSDDTQDVFKFTVFGTFPFITIKAKITGLAGGNVDLAILNENGSVAASASHSGTSNETISFQPALGGTFFVRVNRVSGNTLYNLRIDV